jgi:multimeric flavodoxin WrbA
MNITIFTCNHRKSKSVTYGAASQLIDALLEGGTLHSFCLPQDMPHVCTACYACFTTGEENCPGRKYMEPILNAMADSQLLIFCVPVYVFHLPGQLKTFLDHMGYRWVVHRADPAMLEKQAVIITSAAGAGMKKAERDVRDSMNYWCVARTWSIRIASWGYDWTALPDRFRRKIKRKTVRTVRRIKSHQSHLKPCLKVRLLYSFYRFLHLRRKMVPVDDAYWIRLHDSNESTSPENNSKDPEE